MPLFSFFRLGYLRLRIALGLIVIRFLFSTCSFGYIMSKIVVLNLTVVGYGRGLDPCPSTVVENNGFEPLTLCVQGRCSSQLS